MDITIPTDVFISVCVQGDTDITIPTDVFISVCVLGDTDITIPTDVFISVCVQGDTDITIPTDVPPGRREVAVNKSVENGGLGISIKGTHRLRFIQ
jgi:hypothetical protein